MELFSYFGWVSNRETYGNAVAAFYRLDSHPVTEQTLMNVNVQLSIYSFGVSDICKKNMTFC